MGSFFPPNGGTGGKQILFDVRDFGAKGNGIHDDAPAINDACIAAYNYNLSVGPIGDNYGSSVYIPFGHYNVQSPIVYRGAISVLGDGPKATRIYSSFNDWVFQPDPSFVTSGPGFSWLNLEIVTPFLSGAGCIQLPINSGGALIQNCILQSNSCISHPWSSPLDGGLFDFKIAFCRLLAQGGFSNSGVGINVFSGGGYVDIGNDIQGFLVGRRIGGPGVMILGGRQENNVTANQLGYFPDGSTVAISGRVGGMEMEANAISFEIGTSSGLEIHDVGGAQMGEDQGIHTGQYALLVHSSNGLVMRNFTPGGGFFHSATARIEVLASQGITFENCDLTNGVTTRPSWDLLSNPSLVRCVNSNQTLLGQTSVIPDYQEHQALRGLYAKDSLNNRGLPANFTGFVTVPSGSTSVVVNFPPSSNGNSGGVQTVPSAGGSLASGTYFYKSSFVTARGESASTIETSVTLTGSNHTVTAFWVGPDPSSDGSIFRVRIYRGTTTGVYDGFWDLPLKSVVGSPGYKTIVDDGTVAFTGVATAPIPASGDWTGAAEPDTNYRVMVESAWSTARPYVLNSDKTTSGFTIHFENAPGSDTVVGWMLYR